MTTSRKVLLILIDDTQMWEGERLDEVLVRTLQKLDVAGATVLAGTMGYGEDRRLHRKGLFGLRDEKPILILATDEEAKLRAALPSLRPLIPGGLIMMLDAEVITDDGTDP